MRSLFVVLLVAVPIFPATRWVGSGTPAGYDAHYAASDAGLQSAMDDAAYGDTIVLQAGTINDVNVIFPYKTGNGWITVKCDKMPRLGEGYRVNPTTNLPLCKLIANSSGTPVIEVVAESESVSLDTSTDRITGWDGGTLAEGTPIVLTTDSRHGVYVCDSLNSPINPECSATRVDYFVNRIGAMGTLTNGTPVYLYGGDNAPGGITYNRWYYVVNSAANQVQLAETQGGAAIDITSSTAQAAANIAVMAYPLVPYNIYYVRNPTATDFQVSATANGPIIDIVTAGASLIAGRADRRIRGWKFQGIEISKADGGSRPFYLIGLGSAPRHVSQMAQDFIFDQMYVHGYPWQDGPRRGFFINANNVSITNSYISENHDFNSQSNAVFVLNSNGPLHFENNYLSGQGESVFLGGSSNSALNLVPSDITFRRNWFDRPLEWYQGLYLSRTSATLLHAQVWNTGSSCGAASSLRPGMQCLAYRPGNSTACKIDEDSTVSVATTPTGAWGFGITDSCGFEFRFVGNSGDYTCTGGITCVAQASLDWTGIVNRIRSGTTTAGVISSTMTSYRFDMRNNFETKNGQRILLDGNVFSGSYFSSSFDCHLTLNVQLGSQATLQWWVQSSEHLIQNNIFRTGVCALSAAGSSSHTSVEEISGFRQGKRNAFRNNLSWDIGSYNWGKSTTHNSSNRPIYLSASDHFRVDHNTVADVDFYSVVTAGSEPFSYQSYTNNIFVPRAGSASFPHLTNLEGGGNGYTSVMNAGKCITNTCTWLKNAVINTSGSSQTTQYPNSFLVTANQSVTSLNFANYAARNYRIASGDYAAGGANAGTDGRALGADQDEIEALTGALGADVEAGIPEFSRRANLILTPSTITASLAFTPGAASTCTVNVWDNSAYSGAATFSIMTGSGTARRSVSITGLTTGTQYYGKLICGSAGTDGIAILRFRTR